MEWWVIIPAAVSLASLIAKITPNKTDDKIVFWVLKVVDMIALSTGKTKLK